MRVIKHTTDELIVEKPGHRIELTRWGYPEATVTFFRNNCEQVCAHTTWLSDLRESDPSVIVNEDLKRKLKKQEYALAELHKFIEAPDFPNENMMPTPPTATAVIKTETVVTKKVVLELTPEQAAWVYLLTGKTTAKDFADKLNVAIYSSLHPLFWNNSSTVTFDRSTSTVGVDQGEFQRLVNSLKGDK